MKRLVYLIALLGAATSTRVARAEEQEIHECEYAVNRCISGDARVTLAGGVVKRVEVNVIYCGRPGGPGYSCTIDSSRGDQDSKWSKDGGATVVANASPFDPDHPDRVKITVGRHVSIDLDEAQSLGRCGAGAELPRAIVITAQRKQCRVWGRAQ